MAQVGKPRSTKIEFPEADLDRLQRQLDDARLPDVELAEDVKPWEYGTDLAKLKQVLADWKAGNPKDSHNRGRGDKGQGVKAWWRGVEKELNSYPHYLVEIETMTIHYQVFKSSAPDDGKPAIPFIFVHGWPGSFTEGFHFAAELCKSKSPRFDVIVPSLPGYALSSQPPRKNWTLEDSARVFDTLMTSVLGFKSYMAQGGDWGSMVVRFMANSPNCKIYHVNFLPPRPPFWTMPVLALEQRGWTGLARKSLQLLGYAQPEVLGIERALEYQRHGSGYVAIQGTQPSTLGYALYDNPVGNLCWILEKFQAWSDPRCPAFNDTAEARSDSLVTDENILIDVMFYLNTVHTSFLPYKTSFQFFANPNLETWAGGRAKPFGYTHFLYELAAGPENWISRYKLKPVYIKRHDFGGHFAALDNPAGLVEDMQEFAGQYWPGV
ncbi:alpha/beta-hydrolase [Testicularia cyperi]|uniref:Alpha/beta-hydrolase n=1 Tax=Testicularia cyperi TaxID=1882483 RepID=A0A317XKY6_9BASI|nr:alpha/beta-hydrolase [Testicularia cyperi]